MLEFVLLLMAVAGILGGVIPPGLQTQLEGRIVEGRPTAISFFPYQISLHSGGYHSCGGSIISEQIVVTAAHCLYRAKVKTRKVRAGSSQWTSGGVYVGVKMFKIHEHYNPYFLKNDIAVILLNTSLVFSFTIRPIKLSTVAPKSGALGVVSGWGITQYLSLTMPTQLRYVELTILSQQDCKNSTYNHKPFHIGKGTICTYRKGKDSCKGDSGGPLVSGNELVGVVSAGYGCAFENYPGVYTSVAYMHDWILETKAALEEAP